MSDIDALIELINKFRDERNWRPFHNAKDLALSISVEAAELLEIFQWRDAESAVNDDFEHLKEEVADVLIYCFMLTDSLEMDIRQIIEEKISKNTKKYPAV